MDKLNKYREIVKNIILKYAKFRPSHGEIQLHPVFDEQRDHYALMQVGWDQEKRIKGNLIYLIKFMSSDHVLDEKGMNEWVNSYENQPRNLAIGNFAHENAEKFIAELPEGLDSERTVSSDNGTVRLDRTDWNGNIFEIKPETDDAVNKSAYQNQVDKQVKIFQGAYPERGEQTGKIVTYNPQKVEQEMINKGLLSPSPKNQLIDSNNNSTPDSNINNVKEVKNKEIKNKEDNKKEVKTPKITVSAQPYTDDLERFLR